MIQPAFLGPLDVRLLDDQEERWMLLASLSYRSAILRAQLTVPAGLITDMASIPKWFFIYLTFGGRAKRPAVLHDFLYQLHLPGVDQEQADAVFDEAMQVIGEPTWAEKAIWLGVTIGGAAAWATGPARRLILNPLLDVGTAGLEMLGG